MSVWRFIAESGNELSPVAFAVVAATFGYVGSFTVVGLSAMTVALLVGLCIRETVGRRGVGEERAEATVEPAADTLDEPSTTKEAPPPVAVPR